jgi:sphingosine kinase
MAYMSPGTNFFSAAMVNDGLMDLITIEGPVPPLKAIDMQLGVETGHFFDNPFVKYRKVSAYRIIPRTSGEGVISIDGERVPFEPFQAEVHHALALTLSKSGAYEAPGPKHWDKVTVSERSLP